MIYWAAIKMFKNKAMLYVILFFGVAAFSYALGSYQTSNHYRRILAENDSRQAHALSKAVQKIRNENDQLNKSIHDMAAEHATKVRELEASANAWRKKARASKYDPKCRIDSDGLRAWNAANRGVVTN